MEVDTKECLKIIRKWFFKNSEVLKKILSWFSFMKKYNSCTIPFNNLKLSTKQTHSDNFPFLFLLFFSKKNPNQPPRIPTSLGNKNSNLKAQLAICSPLMLLFSSDKSERCCMICAFSIQQFLSRPDTLTCGKCTYRSISFHSHDLKYLGFTNAFKCVSILTN